MMNAHRERAIAHKLPRMRGGIVTDRLRRRIAEEAARKMFANQESSYLQAKRAAGRSLAPDGVRQADVPTDAEVREELEQLISGGVAPEEAGAGQFNGAVDRFRAYQLLLQPLERVQQSRASHPEGDALYHSLQVFDLARAEIPYDEEFLLAALLHDVGKAIAPGNHVVAGLEALEGLITERTAWLIEHHPDAQALREGTLGVRSQRRLRASEDFEELMLLAKCDRQGRVAGVLTSTLEEALEYVRDLAESCGEESNSA